MNPHRSSASGIAIHDMSLSTLAVVLAVALLSALALAPSALGTAGVARTIGAATTNTNGGEFNVPRGVAVNQSGAGGVAAGSFYVSDSENKRVQRFDPSGAFVSAWGFGVGAADNGFEICTEALTCRSGTGGTGGFGSPAGPQGIAVDQSNGNVYVADQKLRRIDIYKAGGAFEGAFGWGAVHGNVNEFQFCTALIGCASGVNTEAGAQGGRFGAAIGGLAVAPEGAPNAGDIFVADKSFRRIDEFKPSRSEGIVTGVSFVRSFGFKVNSGGANLFEKCEVSANCVEGAAGAGEGQFGANGPGDVAVDSEGNVFAVDLSSKRVEEFSSVPAPITKEFGKAAFTATFATGELLSIAVDPSLSPNHVFVLGKRSTKASQVAVQELDHTGASVQVDGTEMTSNTANGIAVVRAPLGSNVYVASAKSETLEGLYVLNGFQPAIAAPTEVSAHSAVFHGTVVSEGLEAGYRFEYSTDGQTWTSLPTSEATVPATSGSVAVEREVTGLVGSQTYFVRLAQTRPLGQMTLSSSATAFTTPASAPVVSASQASGVGFETATLTSQVDPENRATSWYFEYISQNDWSANGDSFAGPHPAIAAPASAASAGEGGFSVLVSEAVSGLDPDTAYRFRLVAANGAGSTVGGEGQFATYVASEVLTGCLNEAFRSFAGAALPDCRAYEQASPVEKLGARVGWGYEHATEAAADGSRITFGASAAFPVKTGNSGLNGIYLASRGGGSWSSDGLVPITRPEALSVGQPLGWNRDLSASASYLQEEGGVPGIYLRDTATGDQHLALAGEIASPLPAAFAGTSSSLLFESTTALLPGESAAGKPNAYLMSEGGVQAVGLVPASGVECDGAACVSSSAGSIPGSYNWFNESPSLTVGWSAAETPSRESAISTDGSRIFFTEAGDSAGGLFLRENGTRTVQVSAANSGVTDPNGEKAAAFLQATSDGARAFFLSCQKLTADATAVSTASPTCSSTSTQGQDLYLYDNQAPVGARLTDLSVDHEAGDVYGSQVVGFVGASSDGSDAYFVANGVLASGATTGNCTIGLQATGECSLYLAHVTTGAPATVTVTFVARLRARIAAQVVNDQQDWQPFDGNEDFKSARVSADGTVLFSSVNKLTTYDNHGVPELYRYAPGESGPTCVSCNPTAVAPVGQAVLQPVAEGGLIKHQTSMSFLTRNISADGDRVFFDTPDKLVAADVNGEDGCPTIDIGGETSSSPPVQSHPLPICTDVYEWEAAGSSSCAEASPSYSAQDGGCLYLISSGDSSGPSVFADADESGDNVFFFTESSLVAQDEDQLTDLYDARVDGGLASQQGSPSAPPCTAESCRGTSSAPPAGQSPGSATFSGAGNLLLSAPAPVVKAKAKPLSRAQKLARALRVCRERPKRKRAACGRRARKRYGVAVKAKRSIGNTNRRAK